MHAISVKPIILCGGSGSRLWPLSTPERPKQFLSLLSMHSMIRLTRSRLQGAPEGLEFSRPIGIGSVRHKTHLEEGLPEADLLLEPFGRNSAPAVAAACLCSGPDDILIVLPADHSIADIKAFHEAIAKGASLAAGGHIVTFGIEPTYPATGYGYIRSGARQGEGLQVDAFVEKPDEATAKSYLDQGGYFWNAGIFMFKASVMHDALNRFEPEIIPSVEQAMASASGRTRRLEPAAFAAVKDISIDYAVMERSLNVVTLPVDMGWNDIGGYEALHELLAGEKAGNVVQGPVALEASRGCFVRSNSLPVLVSGVEDLAIVATAEAVMITPKGDSAAVKTLGKTFQSERDTLHVPKRISQGADRFLRAAFETWGKIAWAEREGGFVEQLKMDGTPDTEADRRLGVQARQIFSFSKGAKCGWVDNTIGRAMAERGISYLFDKARHADGGWVHKLSAAGAVIDETRDFYDHAFVILAGAAAWDAFGIPAARTMAFDTLQFLNERLADHVHGGWLEALPAPDYRRAKPHMHLLEAALELEKATGDKAASVLADEVVGLFETRLFRCDEDELIEYFKSDWRPQGEPGHATIEPGHHYEWATLLALHQRLTGRDTLSWQRRLIKRAEKAGLDSDGFAFNAVTALGERKKSRKRLWCQLEMLRARLVHPGLAPVGATEALYEAITDTYLKGMPEGTWLAEIDAAGTPCSTAIPASMLYHFVTAFGMLAKC